jgi:hypothetical protein
MTVSQPPIVYALRQSLRIAATVMVQYTREIGKDVILLISLTVKRASDPNTFPVLIHC